MECNEILTDLITPAVHTIPEMRMWLAMIEDALQEVGVLKSREYQRNISFRMWKETRNWILTKDPKLLKRPDCDSGVSFDWTIIHLMNDPKRIRDALNQMYCSCCNFQLMRQPCKNVVKRIPKNASKWYVDPEFWEPKKSRPGSNKTRS